MRQTIAWLSGLLPTPRAALALGALGFATAFALGRGCGALKLQRGWPTAYTRKLFHLTVFTLAALLQRVAGLPALDAFALGVCGAVLLAVARGPGFAFYEALARESDAPHRGLFVLVSLATTALGGLLAGLAAGDAASIGYLVAGWADGVGEPAGRRFGRHAYRVPGPFGVRSERTLEGSAAVVGVAWLTGSAALLGAFGAAPGRALAGGLAIALATAAAEAVSPHGFDNLTTILAASLTAAALI